MRDFTTRIYIDLLKSFNSYKFVPFDQSLQKQNSPYIILRHDVDKFPQNALQFAEIQQDLGIQGTYFFRIVPESYHPEIIEKIAVSGHEIGYHYEDVDIVYKRLKIKDIPKKSMNFPVQFSGLNLPRFKKKVYKIDEIDEERLIDLAYESFCENLEKFRKIYPVETICMHGSPLSPFDNKIIWKKYDYRKLGIIGEPYFDIDFNKIFYLTDTGHRWDGEGVSVRDKVKSEKEKGKSNFIHLQFRHTQDIINAAHEGILPDKMMITVHPQRWHDSLGPWLKELVWQKVKNIIKKYYYVKK